MPIINEAMLAVNSSPAAAIVAKVTVIAAFGLAGAWMARGSRAAVRHALLAAAFGVMLLLPVASMVAPPVRIAVAVAMQDRAMSRRFVDTGVFLPGSLAEAGAGATVPSPRPARLSLSALWIAAWVAGAALSLLPMLLGLRQVGSLRRSGVPWPHGQSIADGLALEAGIRRRVEVLLHDSLPGPMTCGVLDPAIMLSPDAQVWEDEDLHRAMVHELEHVRRGDWLSHCLARTVCAVYWFHPLVWIVARQLALEAERSCDDAVLGHSEATAYAGQLVALARRLSAAAKSPLLAMANRADLAARVGALLDNRRPRGRAGTLPLTLACGAAAVLVVAMSSLAVVAAPQSASAQTAAAAAPEFEAVSVKLLDPNMRGSHSRQETDPGRLSLTATMHSFVVRAYDITSGQLGGEPDWFKTRLYRIDAVTATPAGEDQMMRMLRRVLADRFQLKLRQEDRDLPVYMLEVAAGGPKFKALKPGEEPTDPPDSPGVFTRSFDSLRDLVNVLNGVNGNRLSTDRPVLDRTHLAGDYNIQLQTEIEAQADASGRKAFQFPNLFHDMQSQLGLKLVPDHARMPYFVVEHVAEPTAN